MKSPSWRRFQREGKVVKWLYQKPENGHLRAFHGFIKGRLIGGLDDGLGEIC